MLLHPNSGLPPDMDLIQKNKKRKNDGKHNNGNRRYFFVIHDKQTPERFFVNDNRFLPYSDKTVKTINPNGEINTPQTRKPYVKPLQKSFL
jgi:hypothetical protein